MNQFNELNDEQKFWYGKLVVAAILADGEINRSEIDFLKEVLGGVTNAEHRQALMRSVESKQAPDIPSPPPGIATPMLAAIFVELMLIMISDVDFDPQEQSFLQELAARFGFDQRTKRSFFDWLQKGLEWKQAQAQLVPGSGGAEPKVPLAKLNKKQKIWYSQLLIAAILLDGQVDQFEMSFLKMAVSFVEDKKDALRLMGFVKNRMAPPLDSPPDLSEDLLTVIFLEILLIVASDEAISFKEQTFINSLSDRCRFSKDKRAKLMEWCAAGVEWRANKNHLIANAKLDAAVIDAANRPKGAQTHKDNNAVVPRAFSCFVCGGKKTVPVFQLKNKSQKTDRNIFGIPVFTEPMPGFDFLDYNLHGVMVCGQCFFASVQKNRFLVQPTDKPPMEMSDNFLFRWRKEYQEAAQLFGEGIDQLASLEKTPETVLASYQAAIKAAAMMAEVNHSEDLHWHMINLKAILAQVKMSLGMPQEAEAELFSVRDLSQTFFGTTSNTIYSIRSARMLFLIGLYEGDQAKSGSFLDFFFGLNDKAATLLPEEQTLLQRTLPEIKKAFENRPAYLKKALTGFMLKK